MQAIIELVARLFAALFKRARGSHGEDETPFALGNDLASRIVRSMGRRGYAIEAAPGRVNIVYVEGVDPDGTPNDNAHNVFNDARFAVVFDGKTPKIAGQWEATTEPSRKFTLQPLNPGGAFHIKFGQYTAWRAGTHHAGSASAHEALVQFGVIEGYRDPHKTFKRDVRYPVKGDGFGVNQHCGYDLPHDDMGNSSAGCLVGRSTAGHRAFMAIVKSDPRYRDDEDFVFTTTIMPAKDII